jgi:hypothetical protein
VEKAVELIDIPISPLLHPHPFVFTSIHPSVTSPAFWLMPIVTDSYSQSRIIPRSDVVGIRFVERNENSKEERTGYGTN